MKAEFILKSMEVYKNLEDREEAEDYFMNLISTLYIRDYRNNVSKLDSPEEKEVLRRLLDYFTIKENFRRCIQIKEILNGLPLSIRYITKN